MENVDADELTLTTNLAGGADGAAEGLGRGVRATRVLHRPCAAPTGVVAVDDAGIDLGDLFVVQSEVLNRSPLMVLGKDVRFLEKPPRHLLPLSALQIRECAPLAQIALHVHNGEVVVAWLGTEYTVTAWRLQLDHVGAHGGQNHGGPRADTRLGYIKDLDALQWSPHSSPRLSRLTLSFRRPFYHRMMQCNGSVFSCARV